MYKALLVVAGLVAGQANANLITNGSFEADPTLDKVLVNGNATNAPITSFGDYGNLANTAHRWAVVSSLQGWDTFYGPGIEVQFNNTLGFNANEGNRYVELDAHFAYSKPGNSNTGIFQQLSGLATGQTYELSFWYRARTTKADDNGLAVYWQSNTGPLTQSILTPTVDYNAQAENNSIWTQYKQTLTATSSQMLIGFGGLGDSRYTTTNDPTGANSLANGSGKGALLDNVSLTAVSAPATFGLFGLAALGLMLRRRKA